MACRANRWPSLEPNLIASSCFVCSALAKGIDRGAFGRSVRQHQPPRIRHGSHLTPHFRPTAAQAAPVGLLQPESATLGEAVRLQVVKLQRPTLWAPTAVLKEGHLSPPRCS